MTGDRQRSDLTPSRYGKIGQITCCIMTPGQVLQGCSIIGTITSMTIEDHDTFKALQRLEQGKFQELGDEVLPLMRAELARLLPNATSDEGKTRTGHPDSYVGDSPKYCTHAVEYTTDKSHPLVGKFKGDYKKLRVNCPDAKRYYFVTNRSHKKLDDENEKSLTDKGTAEGIDVNYIFGEEFAVNLNRQSQHIREKYLGIPIGAHTRLSLISKCQEVLTSGFTKQQQELFSERYVQRNIDTLFPGPFGATREKAILVHASSGYGKTTWSIKRALEFSALAPVVMRKPKKD